MDTYVSGYLLLLIIPRHRDFISKSNARQIYFARLDFSPEITIRHELIILQWRSCRNAHWLGWLVRTLRYEVMHSDFCSLVSTSKPLSLFLREQLTSLSGVPLLIPTRARAVHATLLMLGATLRTGFFFICHLGCLYSLYTRFLVQSVHHVFLLAVFSLVVLSWE